MHKLALALPSLALLAACGAGTGKVDGGGDSGAADVGGDGADGGDADSGASDGSDGTGTTIEDFVSDWVGSLALRALDDAYGWDDCTGELSLDVDPDGEVDGDARCVAEDDGGWGEPDVYEARFAGTIDDDGLVVGVLTVDAGSWGDVEMAVDAVATADGLTGTTAGETTIDGWGDETYTLSLEGELDLTRE